MVVVLLLLLAAKHLVEEAAAELCADGAQEGEEEWEEGKGAHSEWCSRSVFATQKQVENESLWSAEIRACHGKMARIEVKLANSIPSSTLTPGLSKPSCPLSRLGCLSLSTTSR